MQLGRLHAELPMARDLDREGEALEQPNPLLLRPIRRAGTHEDREEQRQPAEDQSNLHGENVTLAPKPCHARHASQRLQ